ncbi:hypothetical protein VNO77_14317 [Canavalia gladiata]|uniref:Uncharacterized protein n=1 Tax=Canavalia gladiata TaxID=3824 RepID=A0AAN9QQX7_CANGL
MCPSSSSVTGSMRPDCLSSLPWVGCRWEQRRSMKIKSILTMSVHWSAPPYLVWPLGRSCQHLEDFLVGLAITVCIPFSLFMAK